VCHKIVRREECIGRTPIAVTVRFDGPTESKKFRIKKIGYETLDLYVDASARSVATTLERSRIFRDPETQTEERLKAVQSEVNRRLSQIIYAQDLEVDPDFVLIGERSVYRTKDGLTLSFPVLVNNPKVLKELRKAGRIPNVGTRRLSTLKVLNESGVFGLFDAISRSSDTLPVDFVVFHATYPRSRAALDQKQVTRYKQHYVGSYYTNYGDVTHRVDKYETRAATRNETVVKESSSIVEYLFAARAGASASQKAWSFGENLRNMRVVTNDGARGGYESVDLAAGD
jgi:hypothetical protein